MKQYEFKEAARKELDNITHFKMDDSDDTQSIIRKAKELSYCDSIIEIGNRGDAECQEIASEMQQSISNKEALYRALRRNFAICIARDITKNIGYETFASACWGNDDYTFFALRSDGFNQSICKVEYDKIKQTLPLFKYKSMCFTSKGESLIYHKRGQFIEHSDFGCYYIDSTEIKNTIKEMQDDSRLSAEQIQPKYGYNKQTGEFDNPHR